MTAVTAGTTPRSMQRMGGVRVNYEVWHLIDSAKGTFSYSTFPHELAVGSVVGEVSNVQSQECSLNMGFAWDRNSQISALDGKRE